MDDKRLQRVFAQVKPDPAREEAILTDLLKEKKEAEAMKHGENRTYKRKIPAALAAAVLVLALAGTALAVEIIQRVSVTMMNPDEENVSTEGFQVDIQAGAVPLESVPEEARERVARSEEDLGLWAFQSWTEAAEYVGLDLPENPVLAIQPKEIMTVWSEEPEPSERGKCLVGYASAVSEGTHLPTEIFLSANYKKGEIQVYTHFHVDIDFPGVEELLPNGRTLGEGWVNIRADRGEYPIVDARYATEEYVTPSGLTAQLITSSGRQNMPGFTHEIASTGAYFVWHDATCFVSCKGPDPEARLTYLKQILDAYE